VKNDKAYIKHMLSCIEKILKFTRGLNFDEFAINELVQDAVIRNIEVIGEASKHVSNHLKQTYFDIPWKEISGMRNKLIHDYMGVDIEVVWKTVKTDITQLRKMLRKIELPD
jgi:uncharacterized protein with HEPN domain